MGEHISAPLRVLISGATGPIGTALAARLAGAGHEVGALTRRVTGPADVSWDPAAGRIDQVIKSTA